METYEYLKPYYQTLPQSMQADLHEQRACMLVIDDQEYFISERSLHGHMARYHETLPKFISLCENYMPVIHVAFAVNKEHPPHQERSELYNPHELQITDALLLDESFDDNSESRFAIDFLHPFNPDTDRYAAKRRHDALSNEALSDYITRNQFSTVLLCGVFMGVCIRSTGNGLANLKNQEGIINHIVVINDLTDHEYKADDFFGPDGTVRRAVKSFGYAASSQDILSILNPELDMDMPPIVNQQIIENDLRPKKVIARPLHMF